MGMVSPKEAIRQAGRIPRPLNKRKPYWTRMRKVLKALCRYLPSPYPGMRRLSDDTGIPYSVVQRLLAEAEGLGLIARVARGHGYAYRMTFLDDPVGDPVSELTGYEEELRSSEETTSPLRSSESSHCAAAKSPQRKENRYPGECCVCGFQVRAREGLLHGFLPVHGFCDTGIPDRDKLLEYLMDKNWQREQAQDWAGTPAFGEDPEAPLQVHDPRPTNPAARLAAIFEEIWRTDVLKKFPDWKRHRCLNTGAAIGYIGSVFLDKDYSPEHVEAYFDAFFDEILYTESDLQPKEGQSVWQLFTGWWGKVPVADPRVERERREEIERAWTWVREQQALSRPRKEEAWARIEAAQARGERPDDEDLNIVFPGKGRRRKVSIAS